MNAGPPDPGTEAARALRLADRARHGGRLLSVLRPVSRPLVAWGLAWIVEAAALRLLPRWPALGVATAAGVAAVLTTVLARSSEVRSPWAQAAARSWWALLLASAVLVWVLTPLGVPLAGSLFVTGIVWGLGILLYGIASRDRLVTVLGAVVVLLPGPLSTVPGGLDGVFVYGVLAGGAMLGAGLWMTVRQP